MVYKESNMNCVNGPNTSREYYTGIQKIQKIIFKEFIIQLRVWDMPKSNDRDTQNTATVMHIDLGPHIVTHTYTCTHMCILADHPISDAHSHSVMQTPRNT